MPASTKKGAMGAYKPRNPSADGDLYMDSATRAKLTSEKTERATQAKTNAAYDAAAKGYKGGGYVMTPKSTPYKCGK